jgi:hypothetical protein
MKPGDRKTVGGFAERLAATENDDVPAVSTATGGTPVVTESVERLLDEVHSVGQELLDDRGYSTAQRYREAIRRFLAAVVPEIADIDIHESTTDILSRKRYYLIRTINTSVERLIEGVLSTQVRQVEILSRLEEVEGLLVDLLQ